MNESGYIPVEFKVLMKPKPVEQKTAGGILMPESIHDKEKYANTEATIVAIGAMAFTEPDWPVMPKVGDKVLFDKYAGSEVRGKDGDMYRLINDREIVAIEVNYNE